MSKQSSSPSFVHYVYIYLLYTPRVLWYNTSTSGPTSKRPTSNGGLCSSGWYDQSSVLARNTHMLHCPPAPTFSWMPCTDRPQFVVCLELSNVPYTDLPLDSGPIRGDVLGWVRMRPTPAYTMP